MPLITASEEQVEREVPPQVLEFGLIRERRGREDRPSILGLDESRLRILDPDGVHGQCDPAALVDEHAEKRRVSARVRVPVAIEAAEFRRGQRLAAS